MNENIDLVEILKNCPKGWPLYSSVYGDVKFIEINTMENEYPIRLSIGYNEYCVSRKGRHIKNVGECTLFPNKYLHDWDKFIAPWYKKYKFDPNTLKPFDRVIVKPVNADWRCSILSHHKDNSIYYRMIDGSGYLQVIPYNEETKHLVSTIDEAPEYYRYWDNETKI